jgi:poly-beta-1,6-N-acetyl-D-glucosamine synthase
MVVCAMILLVILYFIIIFILYIHWFALKKNYIPHSSNISFSIIIPLRNEAQNIDACIRSILDSTYDNSFFEILAIDDHSTDLTANVISKYSNVRYIKLGAKHGKKAAIEEGITHSKNGIIITLDADCVVPPLWLQSISDHYVSTNADAVICPVAISPSRGIINAFETMDTAAMMATTAFGISKKYFYLANGANLSFTKNLFYEVNGYSGNEQIASGDDVFLINKAARLNKKISYLQSFDATAFTSSQPSFSALLNQRKRWATKTKAYANTTLTFVQGVVFLLNLSIVLSILFGVFFSTTVLLLGLIAFTFKVIVDYFFLSKMTSYFKRNEVMNHFIICEFLYLFMIIYMGLSALFPSRYEWKERKLN